MRKRLRAVAAISLMLVAFSCKPAESDGTDDTGPVTVTTVPKALWGNWIAIGSSVLWKKSYYVADSYIERRIDIQSRKYALVSASADVANGVYTADSLLDGQHIDIRLDSSGLAVVHDSESEETIHVARAAPLNDLRAKVYYQGSASPAARPLSAATNVNLLIQNILHTTVATTVQANATNGTIRLEGTVPGDTYRATPVNSSGAAIGPSFHLVSAPGMEESEGGFLILPGSDDSGCFKAYLGPGTGTAFDDFQYHYAGESYPFTLRIENFGAATTIESCTVAWENTTGPTDLTPLAGSYEAGNAGGTTSSKSYEFNLSANVADIPAGDDYVDIRAHITLLESGGIEWEDWVSYRFFRPVKVSLRFYGETLGATIMDPEGRVNVLLGSYNSNYDQVLVPSRSEGYRVAVTHSGTTTLTNDTFYSIALSDPTENQSGYQAVPTCDLAPYAHNSTAPLSFENTGTSNDAPPAFGEAAPAALSFHKGESIVSCLQHRDSGEDIDWFMARCEPAQGANLPILDEQAPIYALSNMDSGDGIGSPELVIDDGGLIHLFYYAWTRAWDGTRSLASNLALKHSWKSGSTWYGPETIATDLDSGAHSLPMNIAIGLEGRISAHRNDNGSWSVTFASWEGSAADPVAWPRFATGTQGGSWTVSAVPADQNLRWDYAPLVRWDGADHPHAIYRSLFGDNGGSVFYVTNDGSGWSTPIATGAASAATLQGFDLSGASLVAYASQSGATQQFRLSGGSFTASFPEFPAELAGTMFTAFPDSGDGSPLFVGHYDTYHIHLFSNVTGEGFVSSFMGATGTSGSPVSVRGDFAAILGTDEVLHKIGLHDFRTRFLPPIPYYEGGITRIAAILGPDADSKAAILERRAVSTEWRYCLFLE